MNRFRIRWNRWIALVALGLMALALAPAGLASGETAPDGWAWTARESGTAGWLHGVAHGNGLLVAVGDGGRILTSPDGAAWTGRSAGGADLQDVAYGGGRFVAVGTKGAVLTSTDGTRWTAGSSGSDLQLSGVAYGGGLFVAVGDQGSLITSADGLAWTARKSGTDVKLYAVTFGGGRFVAVGYQGTVLTSADGVSWASHSAGTAHFLSDVAYGNGTYLAVGEGDTVATSADGATWTAARISETDDYGIWTVVFGQDHFVAAGGAGNILSSADGAKWVRNDTDRVFSFLDDLDYVDGQFIAVGNFGVIRTSGSAVLKPAAPTEEGGAKGEIGGGTGPAPGDGGASSGDLGRSDGGTAAGNRAISVADCEAGKIAGPRISRQVGQLLIEADGLSAQSADKVELCGNVAINHVLKLDGKIALDKDGVTGNGLLYVESSLPQFHGAIPLYQGHFQLKGDVAELLRDQGMDRLSLGGFDVQIKKLKLIPGGVDVGANLILPKEISEDPIPVALRVTGGRIDMAKISLPPIQLGSHGGRLFTLDKVMAEYDAGQNAWSGQGRLVIADLFGVQGAVGMRGGRLDRVGLGLQGFQAPIDETGFFLTRLYGEVNGLTNLSALKVTASADITGGPQIKEYAVIKGGDLTLVVDLSGSVTASGTVKLAEMITLKARLTISRREHYVEAQGDLNALGIYTGTAKLRVTGSAIRGEGGGTLRIPAEVPWIGGMVLAQTHYTVGSAGLASEVTYARIVKSGCLMDWNLHFSCSRSYHPVSGVSYTVPLVASAGTVAALPDNTFVIPEGMEQALVGLTWDAGDADFSLVAPDGTVITPATADPNVGYEKHTDRHEAFYALLNPQPGTWRHIVNLKGGSSYRVELVDVAAPPSFALTAPIGSLNATGGPITVRWTTELPAGSQVSLYYATSPDDLGILIADGLDAAAGSYAWTPPADLASGTYLVYGLLDDGQTAPVKAVAPGRITAVNPATPAVPRGLTARAVGGRLELTWQPNSEASLGGYRLHLLDTGETVALGQVTAFTWDGLTPGKSYRVAISAYSADGLQSAESAPVTVFLPAAAPPKLSVQWPGSSSGLTNRENAAVSGTIEPGATGTLYLDDQAVGGPLTGTFTANVTLQPGSNRLRVVAVKPDGNSAEQAAEIYLDATPPELTVNNLTPEMTAGAVLLVSGRTEPGASLTLNGKAVPVAADGAFAVPLTLRPGSNAVELVAKDEAGNQRFFRGTVQSTGAAAVCGTAFPDVPAGSPACRSVELLAALGVVKGYPDGTFQPGRQVTRAEFAKMLVVALGRAPAPGGGAPFPDTAGHWAASQGYLQVAVALKAVAGFPDGTFHPDDPVTRAEAVKTAAAAVGLTPGGAALYADVHGGDWFAGWIGVAYQQHLIGPQAAAPVWTEGLFRPDQPATRAEAAMLLANLVTR